MRKACFKRIFCALLALVLVVGYAPAPASQADDIQDNQCGKNLTWTIDNGVLEVTGTGDFFEYSYNTFPWDEYRRSEIKEVIIGEGVTNVGAHAFQMCYNLTKVTLPSTITQIGEYAFHDSPIEEITVPVGVSDIGVYAFGETKIKSLVIPEGVTWIGCTSGCSELTEVILPSTAKKIGSYAFSGCESLKSIDIPSGVTYIDQRAFLGCSSIETITVPNGISQLPWAVFEGCTNLKSIVLPKTLNEIRDEVFLGCIRLSDVYFGGSEEEWNAITKGTGNQCLLDATIHYNSDGTGEKPGGNDIQENQCGKNLTWKIDNGVLEVTGTGDFFEYSYNTFPWDEYRRSEIKEVIIGEGVTNVGAHAFQMCYNLTKVTLPSTITQIGEYAFHDSPIEEITVPVGVSDIGVYAFGETKIKSLVIPEGVTWIGCTSGCSELTEVILPSTAKKIGSYAFSGCESLKSIDIPSGVTYIDQRAFLGCSSIETITVPNGISQLPWAVFEGCTNLKSIVLPKTLNEIRDEVFLGCIRLSDVYFGGSEEKWNAITKGTGNQCLLDATIHFCQDAEDDCEQVGHSPTKVKTKPATLTADGCKSYYQCNTCGKLFTDSACTNETSKDKRVIPAVGKVKISDTSYSYDGKVKRPAVGVYDANGTKLKKDTDYTVTYAKGRKSVGKYNVTVKGIGNYSFKTTLTFKINPPKSAVYTPKAQSKGFTAKWVKKTSQVTGYQLQYALSSDFSDAKTVTIKDNTTVSKTVKGLKSKKTYYIRIRTYKVVGSSKFYSSWSSAKSVKTK